MRSNEHDLFTDLEAIKQREPALGGLVDLQRALLESAHQPVRSAPLAIPETAQIHLWLQQGIPLLGAIPVNFDGNELSDRFQQVCQICARHLPEHAGDITAFERQAGAYPEALQAEVIAVLRVPLHAEEGTTEEKQELFTFLLAQSLRPFLQACAAQLAPYLLDEIWQQGYCPVCGGWPDLAYLEDSRRSRHLVCSRCDTNWRFPRIKCPFCGTTEAADLRYYPGPEEKYRLYVCHQCRRYLKALDTTCAGASFFFPVERVLTLSMDLAAQEAGYA